MSTTADRMTLAEHLAGYMLAPVIETKGMFKKTRYISLYGAVFFGHHIFQQGAVLGHARANQAEILGELLATPGRGADVARHLVELAKANVDEYGQTPEHFMDFFTKIAGEEIGAAPNFAYEVLIPESLDGMKRVIREKVRLGEVLLWLDVWFHIGVGFGLAFPEVVATMWRNDQQKVANVRPELMAALNQAEQDCNLPLAEMEQAVLSRVAVYARQFVPEVVEPLGLP